MSDEADPASYRVTVEIPVRFRDTDAMGHVNNAVYLTYLEVGREAYWRERFGLLDYRQIDLIVARVEIDFRSPATVGETVFMGLRTSAIGRRSFDFTYDGWTKGSQRHLFSARSVQVMYDYGRMASKEVSKDMRREILAFEVPGSVTLR